MSHYIHFYLTYYLFTFKVLILTCQISVREDKRDVYCHPVTRNNVLPPGNYYPVISDYLARHWHITRKCDPRQPVIRWTISQLMSYLITTASLALLVIATSVLSWMTWKPSSTCYSNLLSPPYHPLCCGPMAMRIKCQQIMSLVPMISAHPRCALQTSVLALVSIWSEQSKVQ